MMFTNKLSRIFYNNSNKLSNMQNKHTLNINANTSYEYFINQILYDKLNKNGCILAPINSEHILNQHDILYDVYSKNLDKLENISECQVFVDGTTFDEFESLLAYDFFLKYECIYNFIAEKSSVEVTKCIKDEQINILAMTEGVTSEDGRFYQTVICKRPSQVRVGDFYFLTPKVSYKSEFQKSFKGLNYQSEINNKYGYHLHGFNNNYIAQAVFEYPMLEEKNHKWTLDKLKMIKHNIFPLWESEGGPLLHMEEHNSSLFAFRVYKIAENAASFIKNTGGRIPAVINGKAEVTVLHPVLEDEKFRIQQVQLLKVMMH